MKTIIIGGVAAGASTAARLRRLDEHRDIQLLEKGNDVSYANCGLPYHIGNVIEERNSLLVMPAKRFASRYNVTVRTNTEVRAIDRGGKTVTVLNPDGKVSVEPYDTLVIATGSSPIIPPLPGVDLPEVTRLWDMADMDAVIARAGKKGSRALVVGAGFIGLEVAENLNRRGLSVTVIDLMDQVLPTLDKEMAQPLAAELARLGIKAVLGVKLEGFRKSADGIVAMLAGGDELTADFAALSIGVRPNSELAKRAGLEVGPRGHIVVDETLRTSDEHIYAAGDVIEVRDPILGGKTAIPLAGPANRQGRIVAGNIAGRKSEYYGSLGTSIVKIGDVAAASSGYSERRLRQAGVDFIKIYHTQASNAAYYPGGKVIYFKLLFSPAGKILGAQAVGSKGVDKRMDVIATAMRAGMDVRDLAELELSYAPPFGSARDPVNMLGMIAGNVLDGTSRLVYPDELPGDAIVVDVRDKAAFAAGSVPGARNIPLGELRKEMAGLDKTKRIIVSCQVGATAYLAEQALRQHGFDVYNLTGGYSVWKLFNP